MSCSYIDINKNVNMGCITRKSPLSILKAGLPQRQELKGWKTWKMKVVMEKSWKMKSDKNSWNFVISHEI